MSKPFTLEIITPDRVVLSDDAVISFIAPGSEGYLGVLADHAALMTQLGIGRLDFRGADGESSAMAITGGFLEVLDNTATVLAEAAERASDIDVERAERALQRAQERLASHDENIDIDRAQAAMKRALNRLNVAHAQ